jgi:hypothetical protein
MILNDLRDLYDYYNHANHINLAKIVVQTKKVEKKHILDNQQNIK